MSTIGVAAALTAEHAEHLAQFRIPPEMLDTAGVRSVTDIEAREILGINGHRDADLSGILFPYRHPVTGERCRRTHSVRHSTGRWWQIH